MACYWGGHAEGPCFPDDELAGRSVVVTLDLDDPTAIVTGVLVERTCDGEVTVDNDQGRWHGWPALRVTGLD